MSEGAADRVALRCRELVELVTDYLTDDLDLVTAAAVAAHLRACPECRAYLWQMRSAIAATRQLRGARVPSGPRRSPTP